MPNSEIRYYIHAMSANPVKCAMLQDQIGEIILKIVYLEVWDIHLQSKYSVLLSVPTTVTYFKMWKE